MSIIDGPLIKHALKRNYICIETYVKASYVEGKLNRFMKKLFSELIMECKEPN